MEAGVHDALLVETGLTRACICIDKDYAGYEHAADIRDSFKGTGVDLRFVKAAGDHHDVSDHLAAGLGVDELVPVKRSPPPSLRSLEEGCISPNPQGVVRLGLALKLVKA